MGEAEQTIEKVKQADEMQTQLKELQDKLAEECKEKSDVQEQLVMAQEQLAQTAAKESSPGNLDDLTEENDKLRALVTVGQDNHKQQEELIAHLQEELAKAQTSLVATRVTKLGYMA